MKKLNIIQLITKRGFTLNAFDGDSITKEVQKKGEYDSNTLDSLSEILTSIQPNISLDVGANIGNHALLIAKHSKKVISFEPVNFVFDVLQSNIEQNDASNITAVNFGLSDRSATLKIYIPNNGNLGSSSIEANAGAGEQLMIHTVTGDDYLKQHFNDQQIDFIKMDVEGHEAMALIGLKQTITQYQPLMLLEWKSANTVTQFQSLNLFEMLFSGYEKYSLSYTANKKVHSQARLGFLKRIFHKLIGSRWCLSQFDTKKSYSNVYFVPPRYQHHFKRYPYLV
jgi:FkbM family methyltransferase